MDSGDAQAAVERFRRDHSEFEIAALRLKEILDQRLLSLGMHADVTVRAKAVSSLAKKIFRKNYGDPWGEVTDKVAGRVVLALASDVDRVASDVAGALTDARIEDKRVTSDPALLEYSGVHVTGSLPGVDASGEPAIAEVQIRTIVQDAWSVVSHNLVYKPWIRLPGDAQRRIMRLVALAEIFDEEVGRAVTALKDQPGYGLLPLLDLSEALGPNVGIYDGDRAISTHVLLAIQGCLDEMDPIMYRPRLEELLALQGERITHLVTEYGPQSDVGADLENLLVGQPESLIVMERLTSARARLEACWATAGLPDETLEPFRRILSLRSHHE